MTEALKNRAREVYTNCVFDLEKLTTEFIQSFETGKSKKLKDIMTDDVKSYITNAEGGINLLDGRDVFIHNIEKLDVKTVKLAVKITQMVKVSQNQVMVMVEIKTKRKGRSLHNFAAFLITFKDGLINEIRMVEALPAYSDEFWKG